MWWKEYQDYPLHKPLKAERIESGNGICEMHDLNGWGEEYHHPVRRSSRLIETWCAFLFGRKMDERP